MRFLNLCIYILLAYYPVSAQSSNGFGIKGGLNFTFFSVEEAQFGMNQSTEIGYYAGIFSEFEIDEDFAIQPEVLYIGLNDFQFINVPVYLKYEIVDNFSLLIGPSINYFFDFFTNKLKIRADLSTAYNFTPKLDLHLKYTLGFEVFSPNGLFIGIGYLL